MKKSALVVLSGGQDSVTCLGWALATFNDVYAISFDYGQRHKVELEGAAEICRDYDVPHTLVDISTLGKMVTTNLVGDGDVNQPHPHDASLPSSFVPARNATFLTFAFAHAQELGVTNIVAGMCETDYSGYPDCRENFIVRLQDALNVGYNGKIVIHTPLMHLNKAQTFALAHHVGFLEVVLSQSHTCYNGDHKTRHVWGYGCDKCPACDLRAKGYEEWQLHDYDKFDMDPNNFCR